MRPSSRASALTKEEYLAIQPIYYPGFTFGGLVGEFGGLLTTFLLAVMTPIDDAAFWWAAASCLSLIIMIMHGIYWTMTHPVNNFWLKNVKLDQTSFGFFAIFAPKTLAGIIPGLRCAIVGNTLMFYGQSLASLACFSCSLPLHAENSLAVLNESTCPV